MILNIIQKKIKDIDGLDDGCILYAVFTTGPLPDHPDNPDN